MQVIGRLRQKSMNGTGLDHPHKIMPQRFDKLDLVALSKCMRIRSDQHQPIFHIGQYLQPLGAYIAGNDTDIDFAFRDGAHDIVGESLFQIDIDIRMTGQKFGQHRRQEFRHRRGIGKNAHMPFGALHILSKVAAQIRKPLQY